MRSSSFAREWWVMFLALMTAAHHPVLVAQPSVRFSSPLQIDSARYVPKRTPEGIQLRFVVTYTNRSDRVLFVEGCGQRPMWILDRAMANGWRRTLSPPCPLVSGPPLVVLAPGESRVDTIVQPASPATQQKSHAEPRLIGPVVGRYRLVYYVHTAGWGIGDQTGRTDPNKETLLPIEQRASKPFVLR